MWSTTERNRQQVHNSSNLQVQPFPWRRTTKQYLSKQNNTFSFSSFPFLRIVFFSSKLPDESFSFRFNFDETSSEIAFMQKKKTYLFVSYSFFFSFVENSFFCGKKYISRIPFIVQLQVGKQTSLPNSVIMVPKSCTSLPALESTSLVHLYLCAALDAILHSFKNAQVVIIDNDLRVCIICSSGVSLTRAQMGQVDIHRPADSFSG